MTERRRELLGEMAQQVADLMTSVDDAHKDYEDIDIKSDDEVIDQTDDNAEAIHDGNAEVDVKAITETLARMTRYVSIQ